MRVSELLNTFIARVEWWWCIVIIILFIQLNNTQSKDKTAMAQRLNSRRTWKRRWNSFDVLCVLFSRRSMRSLWQINIHIHRVYPRLWMIAAVWAEDLSELCWAISSLYQVEMQRDFHIRTQQTFRNTYI